MKILTGMKSLETSLLNKPYLQCIICDIIIMHNTLIM